MSNNFTLNYDGYWREPNVGGIPGQSGVYTVYSCTFNASEKTVSLKKVLYIGESANVKQRIANHEKWPEWKQHLRHGEQICINFAPIGSVSRERVEAALIYKHKPPVNTEYKNSFPFPQTTVSTSGKNALLHSDFTVNSTRAAVGTQW